MRFLLLAYAALAAAAPVELGRGPLYIPFEVAFTGPSQGPRDTPSRDITLWAKFRHERGAEHVVHGFWDGDGRGGMEGAVFKVRFTPTIAGRWTLVETHSNRKELAQQKQGAFMTAVRGTAHGFWIVDDESPGRRWYRRSDGTHQYIVGNTQYSFLSETVAGGEPVRRGIAMDVAQNAGYFRKLRFSLLPDRYPHKSDKPFLDDRGRPTDSGDYSHRPNPSWFHERADTAVRVALEMDLIADLILCGPDEPASRSTLRPAGNGGDAEPYLRYVAARFGSFPNAWFCLCNEYDIKKPSYAPAEMAKLGRAMRGWLPYATPLSVHPGSKILWADGLDDGGWPDHHIIQRKIRELAPSASVIDAVWRGTNEPRNRPTVNDELSYQGEGDRHSEQDTLESHLGAFLGGGYASTGYKPVNKRGAYFWGSLDTNQHTAAEGLRFLRMFLDEFVRFWMLAPGKGVFGNAEFPAMEWAGAEYVLGSNRAASGLVANLPPGNWTVRQADLVSRRSVLLSRDASGRFLFDTPDSRAALTHFRRNETEPPISVPAASPPQLHVSDNGRFLTTAEGKPFFWLGDTVWAMFLRASTREEPDQPAMDRYLQTRAAQGFNVIKSRLYGDPQKKQDARGRDVFEAGDFSRPATRPGPDDDAWDSFDYMIRRAAHYGLYVAVLPVWIKRIDDNDPAMANPEIIYRYGRFLGQRYAKDRNIIWTLGGDPLAETNVSVPKRLALTRALAEGIADGVNGEGSFDGNANYSTTLMSFHPRGWGDSSSVELHDEPWLDFNMIQTTTQLRFTNYDTVARDYRLMPPKPTFDAEACYENSLSLDRDESQAVRTTPWHVRKAAYWNVFSGGLGHTYGHRSFIMWIRENEKHDFGAETPWYMNLDAPGALQMIHLRRLMESRPYLTRVPDQSILVAGEGSKFERAVATRDKSGSYAMIYLPTGQSVAVRMDGFPGTVRASWFDPRTGQAMRIGEFPARGVERFAPPSSGDLSDWVLVLDAPANRYPLPGEEQDRTGER